MFGQGCSVEFESLCDTGNLLRDPYNGRPVIITGYMTVLPILPFDTKELFRTGDLTVLDKVSTDISHPGTCDSIQHSERGGLLLAYTPDKIIIGGEEKDAWYRHFADKRKKRFWGVSGHYAVNIMLGGIKLVFNLIKKLFVACASNNEIFYINGAETLPSPLPPEEEADIIARLDDEPELRSILVEHNLRLVVYIAKKFENTGSGIEDLISIGTIGLIKAINTFRPDKNIKLATYASRCIENEILMHIRKTSSQRNELSIDEPLNIDWDGNELLLSDIIGSDEDLVYRNLESDEDRKTIRAAVSRTQRERKRNHHTALCSGRRQRNDPKGGS